METIRSLIPVLILFFASACSGSYNSGEQQAEAEAHDEAYFYQKGRDALGQGLPDEAADYLAKADSLRPEHPVIMKYLARACVSAGDFGCGRHYLRKIGWIDADTALLGESVFQSFKEEGDYAEIQAFYEEMNRLISESDTAFTIPERDLHPEGLAYDSKTGSFYIGSIRKRKVTELTRRGEFVDVVDENLFSASGIAVDAIRQKLWIASPAAPQMEGYSEEMQGFSSVFEVDLESGELIQEYSVQDEYNHYFGDLAVHPDGDVFISDSNFPAIYKITSGVREIKLFKHLEGFRSVQGLTLTTDDRSLYVADYIRGLFRIDIDSRTLKRVEPAGEMSMKGMDGIYYYNNSIIAIQNGVNPMRIVHLYLSADGDRIKRFRYLEKNNPVLDEPTLGTIVDDTFYYVANSPWGKYDEDGEMWSPEELPDGLIMKIVMND